MKKHPVILGIAILVPVAMVFCYILFHIDGSGESNVKKFHRLLRIASFIEQKVNIGGYTGCKCSSIDINYVTCYLNFPPGTDTLSVEANVKGVAEIFAKATKFEATIYYVGYSGYQEVCKYKYDMQSASVTKIQ